MAASSEITGPNIGILWNVGASSVYFTHDHSDASPLDNPKFLEAFEKAQAIAVNSLATDDELAEIQVLLEQTVPSFAEIVKKHIHADEISRYNDTLEQLLQDQSPAPLLKGISIPSYANHEAQFVTKLFFYLAATLLPAKEMQDLHEEVLKSRAQQAGKILLPILTAKEQFSFLINLFSNAIKVPLFYVIIDQIFLSEKKMKKYQKTFKACGKAWSLGISASSKLQPLSQKQIERLNTTLLEKLGPEVYELAQQLGETTREYFGLKFSQHTSMLTDRISSLFQTHPQLMIVQPEWVCERLHSAFSERKIQVQPLRESMKPIGFLWEITNKKQEVVGHCLGSVHIVPEWILNSFNSEIIAAFHAANILGVEVDITREEVLKAFPQEDADGRQIPEAFIKEGLKANQIELDEADPEFKKKGLALIAKAITAKHGTESGIDLSFIHQAKARQIEVIDLESIETHQDFLALTQKEQQQLLGPDTTYQQFEESFVQFFCKRFPEVLEVGMLELLEAMPITQTQKEALNQRNIEMALTITKTIRSGKKGFFIFGALHGIGEHGIPSLLEKTGLGIRKIVCIERRN